MRALVTDSHLRNAVAGIRGLGRAGIDVVAVGPSVLAAGGWSRHSRHRCVAPDVLDDPEGFVSAVSTAVEQHGPLILYPGQEASLDAVLRRWDAMPDVAVLPYPGPDAVQTVRDKRELAARSTQAGFPAIGTLAEGTAGQLRRSPIAVPCAVKAPTPTPVFVGTRLSRSEDEFEAIIAALPSEQPVLVQRLAGGAKTSVCLVLDRDRKVVGVAQHETTRSWPAGAGSSSLARSVPVDHGLAERLRDILSSAGFWGLAEIELIATADGLVPIDVNPRFYGTLPLTLASGVNLPAVWHAVVSGSPVPSMGDYRSGVTFRWLEADLADLIAGHRLTISSAGRGPRAGAMWSTDDPLGSGLLGCAALWMRVARRLPRRGAS
jgi:predicted ATP-grasp superfamily ATP-dependent carboligase